MLIPTVLMLMSIVVYTPVTSIGVLVLPVVLSMVVPSIIFMCMLVAVLAVLPDFPLMFLGMFAGLAFPFLLVFSCFAFLFVPVFVGFPFLLLLMFPGFSLLLLAVLPHLM